LEVLSIDINVFHFQSDVIPNVSGEEPALSLRHLNRAQHISDNQIGR
jgi:hypothetical protein